MRVDIDGQLYERNIKVPVVIEFTNDVVPSDPCYSGELDSVSDSSMSVSGNGHHVIQLVLEDGPVGPRGPLHSYDTYYELPVYDSGEDAWSLVPTNNIGDVHASGIYGFTNLTIDSANSSFTLNTPATNTQTRRVRRSMSTTGTGNIIDDVSNDNDAYSEDSLDYIYSKDYVFDSFGSATGSGQALVGMSDGGVSNGHKLLIPEYGGATFHTSITAGDFQTATGHTPRQINTYTNKIWEYYLDGVFKRLRYNTSAIASSDAYSPPTTKGLCLLTNVARFDDYSMSVDV